MKTALLGCCCVLASALAIEVVRVGEALKGSIELLPAIVEVGIDNARSDAVGAVEALGSDLTAKLDQQASGLRRDLRGAVTVLDDRASFFQAMVDDHARVVETSALASLRDATGALQSSSGAIVEFQRDLKPLLVAGAKTAENAASITAQMNEAAPLFLDCDHNPDCAFSRFQGTSKAIERTAIAVGKVAPQFAEAALANNQNVAGITADVHTVTKRIAAPTTFWGRAKEVVRLGLGVGIFAAR